MKSSTLWIVLGVVGALILMTGKNLIDAVVDKMALAIQNAEGWYPGSWSYRTNNPGNITDMGRPGQTGTAVNPKSGIVFPVFDTYQSGFDALQWKLKRVFSGESEVYSSSMSLMDFFNVWSKDPNEAVNVADYLGVSVETTLDELSTQA